jgi:hypothetical protein
MHGEPTAVAVARSARSIDGLAVKERREYEKLGR